MIFVHVEVERNSNSVMENNTFQNTHCKYIILFKIFL